MRIEKPCDWIIERLKTKHPFFSVRFNDGEMAMMYRTVPEGKILGTDVSPALCNYELGDSLSQMLQEMSDYYNYVDGLLIGCSWNTPRADEVCKEFEEDVRALKMADFNWCNEHWPLDGVVDGSTIRMLGWLRGDYLSTLRYTVLVTCPILESARYCIRAGGYIRCPQANSWEVRESIYKACVPFAAGGYMFVWAAGIGLKPTAWKLWKEFPQSSHIDIGHLFNGAFGLKDYGWLQRGDGPWYKPYFENFVPYVKRFIP